MDRRSVVGAFLAAALLACGGGGDEDTLQISYSSTPLSRTMFADDAGSVTLIEKGTVSPVPTEPVFVRVLDSGASAGAVFTTVTLTVHADGTFEASLPTRRGIAAGIYTGALTVQLCKDASCTAQYRLSQPSLPYEIRVLPVVAGLPPLDAAIEIDGVAVAETGPAVDSSGARTYAIRARRGQVVEITPATQLLRVSVSPPGTSVRPTSMQPGPDVGYLVTIGADANAVVYFEGRAEDGRKMTVAITPIP
jgi:hypothetical protein